MTRPVRLLLGRRGRAAGGLEGGEPLVGFLDQRFEPGGTSIELRGDLPRHLRKLHQHVLHLPLDVALLARLA